MATETTAVIESTAEITAAPVDKQPHKLGRDWTFWFDNQSKPKQQGAAWGSSLRKAYTFNTVEDFWWYYLIWLYLQLIVDFANWVLFNFSFVFKILLFYAVNVV